DERIEQALIVREENRNRSLGPEGPDIVDEPEEPNTPLEATPLGLLLNRLHQDAVTREIGAPWHVHVEQLQRLEEPQMTLFRPKTCHVSERHWCSAREGEWGQIGVSV